VDELEGRSSACASATVVNAIATGEGGAFGIELRVLAKVRLDEHSKKIRGKIRGAPQEDTTLMEVCVRKVLEFLGLEREYGAIVETDTGIPIAVGLSSSSAASNAVVLATFAALDEKPKPETVIDLAIDASFEAGVTVTGALDDAAASYLGCGVITNNRERRILKKFTIDPELEVLIHIPPERTYTCSVTPRRVKSIAKFVRAAHRQALLGNVFGAMTLNGLLYSSVLGQDPTTALDAISSGAIAAGLTGTGPATIAISKPEKSQRIKRVWKSRGGRILVTKPSTAGARVES